MVKMSQKSHAKHECMHVPNANPIYSKIVRHNLQIEELIHISRNVNSESTLVKAKHSPDKPPVACDFSHRSGAMLVTRH
jgi:hypothetical protein